MNVLETATDEHPVLYDIFYIVQYLLDIENKFIPKLGKFQITYGIKQNGNYQQSSLHTIRVLGIKL